MVWYGNNLKYPPPENINGLPKTLFVLIGNSFKLTPLYFINEGIAEL